MASKASKPARAPRGTGFGNACSAACIQRYKPQGIQEQARRAVDEMTANGARFSITRRDDGSAGFLWELPAGGDRSRCRRIIAEAKASSAGYWRTFCEVIFELAGGAK
jgi:hypothetical protein